MQTIGILGGMGPVATEELYDRILRVFQDEYNAVQDDEYPPILLYSLPLQGTDETGIMDDEAALDDYRHGIEVLENGGGDFIITPCNTLHGFVEQVRIISTVPVLDLIEETTDRIQEDGIETVGLLASETTYQHELYQQRLDNTTFLTPTNEERSQLSTVIRNIMGGDHTQEDKETIQAITASLQDQGAEAIILGCTELPVIITPQDLPLPVYDTVQILAEHAANRATL